MGRADVELAYRAHRAWSSGDFEGLVELCDPEVEFKPRLAGAVEGQTYRGHDGVRRWWAVVHQAFDRYQTEVREVTDLGDGRLVIELTLRATGHGSGLELEETGFQYSRTRDRKVLSWEWHGTKAEALGAAEGDRKLDTK